MIQRCDNLILHSRRDRDPAPSREKCLRRTGHALIADSLLGVNRPDPLPDSAVLLSISGSVVTSNLTVVPTSEAWLRAREIRCGGTELVALRRGPQTNNVTSGSKALLELCNGRPCAMVSKVSSRYRKSETRVAKRTVGRNAPSGRKLRSLKESRKCLG
jgi:hypothetical protein